MSQKDESVICLGICFGCPIQAQLGWGFSFVIAAGTAAGNRNYPTLASLEWGTRLLKDSSLEGVILSAAKDLLFVRVGSKADPGRAKFGAASG
jgi:hypothetical protein